MFQKNEMMAGMTGQPVEKIAGDTERDYFLSAREAKAGIIDNIVGEVGGITEYFCNSILFR